MRKLLLALTAASLSIPAAFTLPASKAEARHSRHHRGYYYSGVGRRCRHSSGTTGLVAGGAGGAVVGHSVLGGPVGTVAGAVGGALAGRAVDRTITAPRRCR